MRRMERGMREDYLITEETDYRDLCPDTLGHHLCPPGHAYQPKTPGRTLIHYVQNGTGVLCDRDQTSGISVHAGQLFIIFPDEGAYYQADETNPWEYTWVTFSGDAAKRLRGIPRVAETKNGQIFSELIQRARENRLSPDYFVSCLFLLFDELLAGEAHTHRYEENVARYIETNYMRNLTVSELAAMVHLNRSYLSRIFASRYGCSPKQYLTEIRMKRAAELLRSGQGVKETAREVGYPDIVSFSKTFKKEMKCTPRDFGD